MAVPPVLDLLPLLEDAVELTEQDVPLLKQVVMGKNSSVKTLRTRHHEIARLLAMGYKQVEVAAMIGTTGAAIWVLLQNPAFQDLLSQYMARRDAEAVSLQSRVEMVAHDAVDKLQELLDKDDELTPAFVLKATTELLDRAGVGPTSKHTHEGLNVFEIKNRSAQPSVVRDREFIDVTPEDPESDAAEARELIEAGADLGEEVSESRPESGRQDIREESPSAPEKGVS